MTAPIQQNHKQATTDNWAYHATDQAALPRILRSGLLPRQKSRQRGEECGVSGPAVFFCPKDQWALHWNNVLLRFPWPDDAEEDPYGDTMLDGPHLIYTNWFSRQSVPAKQIEIQQRGQWVPLLATLKTTPKQAAFNLQQQLLKIAYKFITAGTYYCGHCSSDLNPVATADNPKHFFSPGQVLKCQCGKTQVWCNSVRRQAAMVNYGLGVATPEETTEVEYFGFCNDAFCPLCWGSFRCLENGSHGSRTNAGYDRWGCPKCSDNQLVFKLGRMSPDLGEPESAGHSEIAKWYKQHRDLWLPSLQQELLSNGYVKTPAGRLESAPEPPANP